MGNFVKYSSLLAEGFFNKPTGMARQQVIVNPFVVPVKTYKEFVDLYDAYWKPAIECINETLQRDNLFIYGRIELRKTGDTDICDFAKILYKKLGCRVIQDLEDKFTIMIYVTNAGFSYYSGQWDATFEQAEKLLGESNKRLPYGIRPDNFFWEKTGLCPDEMIKLSKKIRKFNDKYSYD